MKPLRLTLIGLTVAMAYLALNACSTVPAYPRSTQFEAGRFRNVATTPSPGLGQTLRAAWSMLVDKAPDTTPRKAIPVMALSQADLLAAPDNTLYRLGHSTMLLKLEGAFWLTDPVFSERASPLQWLGPKRFHQPPISLEALPPIKGVILSHDHYDHLDHAAIQALIPKVERFYTPLGVGDRLVAWGVPAAKVQQLDWWQETRVGGVMLAATPAQHFSGRSLSDRNSTLWASWVIAAPGLKLYFSGDTGYHAGFKAIGDKYGPFDLTLMETGAYNEQWADIHMLPEQSLQAHLDLRGKWLLPIHNGTFDLSLHAWHEPFERISALAQARQVALTTPRMGQSVDMLRPPAEDAWWRE